MRRRPLLTACLFLLTAAVPPGRAAAPKAGDLDDQPLLRVEGGGPTAQTTALAFSPDGNTLYAAGYDKVVRAWNRDATKARFVPQARAFRVPIGPGTTGAINCLAVSPDGAWLAVSGLGVVRGEAGFREEGIILPVAGTWGGDQWSDRGLIYLYNLHDAAAGKASELRLLRGHRGVVMTMTFAPAGRNGDPVLVSVAQEPRDDGGTAGRVLVWDVNQPAAPLAGTTVVPQLTGLAATVAPGLAVRRTGAGPKDLRVALTWRDGHLHVWDVAAARQFGSVPDGDTRDPHWDTTAAFLPGPRLLTGGFNGQGGFLQLWNDSTEGLPKPADRQPFGTPELAYLVPRAVCPVRAGAASIAAVFRLMEKRSRRQLYRLYLLDPDDLRPQARADLWDAAGGEDPCLACSPDGRFLAVAGPGTRAIRVFPTDDLLRSTDATHTYLGRPQELRGVGTVFGRLAFARKGKAPELGLFLDDLLFDFANRRLTGDAREKKGWSAVGPADWSVSADRPAQAPGDYNLLWAHGGQSGRVTAHLDELEEVTAAPVVAPPRAGVTANPVVAVATWKGQFGEPQLALYDAGTGLLVRQLKGHAGRITALAVSPDGRFLASAADDETVCLWSLTDLDQVIGKHGTLNGLVLRPQGQDLLVQRVEKGTEAGNSLKPGDVITGLARRKDAKPSTGLSPLQFYLALWDVPPTDGDAGAVWLHVRSKAQPVRLQVEQGVDDRKPVLSVFVVPGAGGEAPRWIAWTPLGPFDASDRDAERYVGWHQNPARLGQPARFADIGQYRKQFYRPRLLPLLLASGNLQDALEQSQTLVPRPVLRVVDVAGVVQPDRENQFLVRDPQVPLRFRIEGPSLAEGEVGSVVVTVDGKAGPQVDLGDASGQELTTTVEVPGRGIHTVHIEARTAGDSPRSGSVDVLVRYQPPPPKVEPLAPKDDRTEVQAADYTFRAAVAPAAAGQKPEVHLVVNGKPVSFQEDGTSIKAPLTLKRGENRIQLTAVNAGALSKYEASETTTVERVIDYKEPQAAQVLFTAAELRPGAPNPRRVPVGAGPLVVDASRIRLLGTATAPAGETLAKVELLHKAGKKPKAIPLPFAAGGREFKLDAEADLEEGPQEFVLVATTAHNKESQSVLGVAFQPPLPDLKVAAPDDGTEVVQDKDRSPGQADVAVTWPLQKDFHGFDVVVRVLHDGKPVPQGTKGADEIVRPFLTAGDAAPFDEQKAKDGGAAKTLATVRLAPGKNVVEVRARNPWREGQVTARTVTFRRPPFIVRMDADSPVTQPFTAITAVVETLSDLPLTEVRVNDQLFQPEQIITETKKNAQRDITAYTVRVKQLALKTLGDNPVRLEVRSDDGAAEDTRIVVVKEAPPKAVLRLSHKPDVVTRLPVDLDFRVESLSPLKRVELKQGDKGLFERKNILQKDRNGFYAVDTEEDKPVRLAHLEEGPNTLVLSAENDGGLASQPFTITYTPPALRLEVDPLPARAEAAALGIHGHFIWRQGEQPEDVAKQAAQVRVYVNNFLQRPPSAVTVNAPERRVDFTVAAVLNQKENAIRIECPGLHLEADGIPDLPPVPCAEPQKPSTLRLLIVNTTEPIPEDELVRHALLGLNLTRKNDQLNSKVFRQVVSYPRSTEEVEALTGYVTQEEVLKTLRQIEDDIRGPQGGPSDVVLIYWLGKDAVQDKNNGEWYLTTSDDPSGKGRLERTAVPLSRLLGTGEPVPGGRVVLLDVVAGKGDRVDWRSLPAAVIRYAWSKQVPFPGLLTALERAAQGKQAVSLQDLAQAAAELLKPYAKSLKLTDNLSYLSNLILTEK